MIRRVDWSALELFELMRSAVRTRKQNKHAHGKFYFLIFFTHLYCFVSTNAIRFDAIAGDNSIAADDWTDSFHP